MLGVSGTIFPVIILTPNPLNPPVRVSSKGLMVVIPFSLKFSSTDDHGKYIEGLLSYSSYVWALQERHVLPKGCLCF